MCSKQMPLSRWSKRLILRLAVSGLFLSAGLGFTAAPALADDAALGRQGETVYPIREPAVRMASEEVRLKVSPQNTWVDVTFTFVNDGPAREVLVGFPVGSPGGDELRGDLELHDFRAWVDGEAVTAERRDGVHPQEPLVDEHGRALTYPAWFTWTIPFESGQQRTVRNTYRATNYHNSSDEAATGYILRTGRVWRGPIGKARIVVELDGILPGQLSGVFPTSYYWQGERMVWEFLDFEPERDITLRFRMRPEVWPGGEGFNRVMAAEAKGGADGLKLLRSALPPDCCEGAPTPLEWALAKFEFLYGSREKALAIARRGLQWGQQGSTLAHLAAAGRLQEPQELLLLKELNPGIRRYLMDLAGQEGAPPRPPVLQPDGSILAGDPDGDLDGFGLTVWLSPDDDLRPVAEMHGLQDPYTNEPDYRFHLPEPFPPGVDAVWYRSWALDGRGHRTESGLVRLNLHTPPMPVVPQQGVPDPATIAPGSPALPVQADLHGPTPPTPAYGWATVTAVLLALVLGYAATRKR